ncbi:metal-dependent hydrolase [Nocardiopsis flavescens]|uniref:LexA-binding, inner membrane-associated putative hydrolase n=1 Tax=Nocardiopsis flavescens TaxID=758803 RepID=A0A1M6S2L8_9ACTN|nr:metal-dependent hydrolase [Nocardiopsis flavescens]SHK38993.1 LexA-binding, inner membrane-associated putative hydrolase [Nocardiopsis flavescens]
MMGTSHAATGVLTGAAVGTLLGSHVADPFICAAVGAGAALLPDLDEPGSTVGRSLGVATEGVSRLLRAASRRVYEATGTARELEAGKDGGHRHLTHTVPAVLVFGALAWGLAALAPLGTGLVVFSMAALGLGTVARAMTKVGPLRKRRLAASVIALLVAAGAVFADGGAAWLVGLTVAVGALTHVLGDWLTRSGVPLAWPFVVNGKRWWMFRSPVAFHTGKSRVEPVIMWGSVAASGVALALGLPALPGA